MSESALQPKEPAAGEIIERLRQVFGVETDAELAPLIDSTKSAVSNWRVRNAPPYPVLAKVAVDRAVSLDWLVFGIGPQGIGCANERPRWRTEAAARITHFVDWWDRTRTGEEVIWLEQQIKRNVPEYRDVLPSDSTSTE